jgi:hypothetical protein
MSINIETVKDIIVDPHAARLGLLPVGRLHARLEFLKIADIVLVKGDDLTVEDATFRGLVRQSLLDLGVGVVESVLVSRHEPYRTVWLDVAEDTLPIQLALKDPLLARKVLVR